MRGTNTEVIPHMHRISRKMVLALVVVGALVAGGAAYTASVDTTAVGSQTVGFGQVNVTGAALTGLTYDYATSGGNTDYSNITNANLTFNSDVSADTVKFGVDGGALTTCNAGTFSGGNTTVVCPYNGTTASLDGNVDIVVTSSNT